MPKEPRWNIDVKSLSDRRLVEIALELDGSEYRELVESLRRELVERLEVKGITKQEIVKRIAFGVPRGRRFNEIAKAWAGILGLSPEEFKRIADAK